VRKKVKVKEEGRKKQQKPNLSRTQGTHLLVSHEGTVQKNNKKYKIRVRTGLEMVPIK